ncbi:MAG: glycosyltransferase [bacterium]|nr:glycosyltransferase [bacterium]
MKILWVATKPPWPPIDGGRLLLHNTLRALRAAGHELTLVAPVEPGPAGDAPRIAAELRSCCRPQLVTAPLGSLAGDWLRAQPRRRPLTIVRHALPQVRERVAALVEAQSFAVVQVEQVQALWAAEPALGKGLPVVLRAQNVESELWAATARLSPLRRPLLALEARRLAAWEAAAVRRSAATVALTREDAARLAALAEAAGSRRGELDGKLHVVPAPFAAELPAAERPLAGSPAVVLFGSGGWLPNRAGAEWFLRDIWPRVRDARPEAMLHLIGLVRGGPPAGDPSVTVHPSPADSRAAYPGGALLVVPLAIASGVRIKILEAWARGVPVIATPEAARGLEAADGRELLLARDAAEFAAAIGRLHRQTELREAVVAAGRRRLRTDHAPERVAASLEGIYTRLCRSTS